MHGRPGRVKSRALGVGELYARFERLHGPRRAGRAYWLALLASTSYVLAAAIERRELAAAAFVEAWQAEDERAWSVETRRRPFWAASTWRAQAELAEASATECEWFEALADLLLEAGRAICAAGGELAKPRRPVIVFDDSGVSHVIFQAEEV